MQVSIVFLVNTSIYNLKFGKAPHLMSRIGYLQLIAKKIDIQVCKSPLATILVRSQVRSRYLHLVAKKDIQLFKSHLDTFLWYNTVVTALSKSYTTAT